jgi:cytoskeletal protein RodZ
MGVSRDSTARENVALQTTGPEPSFGQYLRTIRIQKQMSLAQVAEETRVRPAILRAIEHEDLAHLPPDVFTVGFLRAYAQAVGADGNEAVQRYLAQRRLRQPALAGERTPAPARRNVLRKLVVALAMLAALIATCLSLYRQWQAVPVATTAAISSPPTGAIAAPPVGRSAAPPPSDAPETPSIASASKHLLTIAAHENSWVKVVIDQGAASEHKLKAGDQLRLEARDGFNLLIGNVGGVRLKLDNQPVTVPGKRGEVVNIHLP